MKKEASNTAIIKERTKQQWKLHQQLGAFAMQLDRLPDTQEVRNNRPRSAPQELLPMVF